MKAARSAPTAGGKLKFKPSATPLSLDLAKTWELKEVALELYRLDGRRERLIDLKTYRLGKKTNP